MTSHGTNALIANADGTRISLLTNEPLATAQTTGISRSARTPLTCWALSARSSPSTPAVFLAAILVINATSSSTAAMSSISTSKLLPAMNRLSFLSECRAA
ncbi:hypothetical protein D3C76_1128270 [compost metagenome]